MNWSDIEVDHKKPISSCDVTNDERIHKNFNWIFIQPLMKEVQQRISIKFDILGYRSVFIKPYQFLKLNEEGLNKHFSWWNVFHTLKKDFSKE